MPRRRIGSIREAGGPDGGAAPARRPPGAQRAPFGSITCRRRGVYGIRWWGDARDGKGYRRLSATVYGTRRDAAAELERRRADTEPGSAPAPRLRSAYEEWWWPSIARSVADGRRSEQTAGTYASAWRAHVGPRWGSLGPSDVLHAPVQDWLLGLAPSTARTCRVVLRGVMDVYVARGLLAHNPLADRYDMPADRGRDTAHYDARQLARLFGALRGDAAEPAAMLCALASCRVGEALAVPAAGCVLGESHGVPVLTAPVRRQVLTRTGEVTDRMKNRYSARPVVLCGAAALRLHAVALGRVRSGSEWLCSDGCGGILGRRALGGLLRDAEARAGLPPLTAQQLRPTWVTTVARGLYRLSPEMTEKMMGHSGGGVTGRHYDRPGASEFVEACASAYAERPWCESWFAAPETGVRET